MVLPLDLCSHYPTYILANITNITLEIERIIYIYIKALYRFTYYSLQTITVAGTSIATFTLL